VAGLKRCRKESCVLHACASPSGRRKTLIQAFRIVRFDAYDD
jgi:hypothetical protein